MSLVRECFILQREDGGPVFPGYGTPIRGVSIGLRISKRGGGAHRNLRGIKLHLALKNQANWYCHIPSPTR